MSIHLSFVDSDDRTTALRILFARFPIEEQETRLAEALRSAERGTLNLSGLLLAKEHGQPVGAALMMHQADGVTLVWPPVITCQTTNEAEIEDALMSRLCQEIEQAGSKLAQVLLPPDDNLESELLERHGFVHMTDMFFMARALTPEDYEDNADRAPELDYEIFNDENAGRFAKVIEQTYRHSLDCAFLEGFRNGRDALVSHRLSGTFDPAGWHLYQVDSQDVGVMLMNEHPEQDAVELVYFGIVPEFRGQGLGRQVLANGIQAASLAGRSVMFLAVDCGNVYANTLYGEIGFAELARRQIMVRR